MFVLGCSKETNAQEGRAVDLRSGLAAKPDAPQSVNQPIEGNAAGSDAGNSTRRAVSFLGWECDRAAIVDNALDPQSAWVSSRPTFTLHVKESDVERVEDISLVDLYSSEQVELVVSSERADRMEVLVNEELKPQRLYALRAAFESASASERRTIELIVRVLPRGGLKAFEVPLVQGQPPHRVLIHAQRSIELRGRWRDSSSVLTLSTINQIVDAVSGDFDRDGRQDLALAGFDDELRPTLTWLRNVSIGEALAFRELPQRLPTGSLPSSLAILDIGFEGLDMALAGLDGSLSYLRADMQDPELLDDILRGERDPCFLEDRLPLGATIGAVTSITALDADRDGSHDLVLSGSKACGLLLSKERRFRLPGVRIPWSAGLHAVAGEGAEATLLLASDTSVDEVLLPRRLRGDNELERLPFSDGWQQLAALALYHARESGQLHAYHCDQRGESLWLKHVYGSPDDLRDAGDVNTRHRGMVNALCILPELSILMLCTTEGFCEVQIEAMTLRMGQVTPLRPVFFTSPTLVARLPAMVSRVLADVDGDGALDVAGLYRVDDEGMRLGVWLNRVGSDRSFIRAFDRPANGYASLLALDVNRDRLSDLLLLPPTTSSAAGKLLLASGNGQFEEDAGDGYLKATPADASGDPLVADLNRDGYDDLIWPTTSGGEVSFARRYELVSDGAYRLRQWYGSSTDEVFSLTGELAIFAGTDGSTNFVASARRPRDRSEHVLLYRNRIISGRADTGQIGVEKLTSNAGFESIAALLTGRVLAGGRMGIVVLARQNSEWRLLAWDAERPTETPITLLNFGTRRNPPNQLQIVDVDNNGMDDIAFLEFPRDRHMTLLQHTGTGETGYLTDTISNESLREAAADGALRNGALIDLNGDGQPDLLTHSESGSLQHATPESARE